MEDRPPTVAQPPKITGTMPPVPAFKPSGSALLVLLVLGLGATGCGSQHKAHTQSNQPAPAATTPSTSARDCNAMGINPARMREGTCTHAGVTYVIVDENHTLKLHTLTAALTGIRSAKSLSGARPAVAQGRFVVASIKLTNRLELPQSFDKSGTRQAELILEGTVYPEDARVEASAPGSCLGAKTSLALNRDQVCQVLFDVPPAAATHLGQHGSGDLYLVDFGSDLAGSIPPQVVGQIRLYH